MELMNNSYFIFENIEFNEQLVNNYTELFNSPKIPEKFYGEDYYNNFSVTDDDLIESISYNIYDSTDYWDLLLVYNGIRNTYSLPVNYDIIMEKAEIKFNEWVKRESLLAFRMNEEDIDIKLEEIISQEVELNEKYRVIKYIKPEKMAELKSELNKLRKEKNINLNVLKG